MATRGYDHAFTSHSLSLDRGRGQGHNRASVSLTYTWAEKERYLDLCTNIGKAVLLHIDQEEEDFRLYLLPGFTSDDVEVALTTISTMGLEVLATDEDDGELLDDGSVLIWLAEKSPA